MKRLFAVFSLLMLLSCAVNQQPNNNQSSKLLLHVPSPQWQDQIIYFLMTDRFADGDPSNNDQGAGEYDPSRESHYSGGDIQGVIDHLDYIQNLGATAVWLTPVVANQWWSKAGNYGGYHGYWATDFSQVDAHAGSLQTYRQLSDALHRREMYLIQDIVVNHTGNFFNYQGGIQGYNPQNTAQNFVLLEQPDSLQPRPTQPPFDLIDRTNPAHVKANIYHWTPSISDYADTSQQYTYQLATLADLNTKNPQVINKFKQIYADWISKVGVDAFRIDTVRYVEHDFFHHFMHDPDGIFAAAQATGRDNFLAFGEVFDTSKPYANDAEQRVASYVGTPTKPELNALISFPLHQELKTVFAQGFPTDHLAYRLAQHMQQYANPYIMPTFIDNHDMGHFLASGNIAGLKQALATILTIPGIPTIYQGTAQAMVESRQAMFKGGFMAERDYFNQHSELYRFIAELAKLRTSDKLFTRGSLEIVAANKNGSGVLAYKRQYQGRTVLILMNTARHSILIDGIQVADQASSLAPLFGSNAPLKLDNQGKLTTPLAGRSILIAELQPVTTTNTNSKADLAISTPPPATPVTQNLLISGTSSLPNSPIQLIKNTRMSGAIELTTDAKGNWQYEYPVVNVGQEPVSLVAYHAPSNSVSQPLTFSTSVVQPEQVIELSDPAHDDQGLNGHYQPPQHSQSIGQQDILAVKAAMGGEVLKLTLTMRELTDDWIPANGFDNVAFSIFFDFPGQTGISPLPLLNTSMPNNWQWNMGHVVYGWGNTTFSSQGASTVHQGKKFGIAPQIRVNKATKQITFTYRATDFGIQNWRSSRVYLTTWDISGEGAYRELSPTPGKWHFAGGKNNGAKILDWLVLVL